MHKEPRRRDADLARVAELRWDKNLEGAVDVGVFEHDRRRVAAKLHRHPFHVQTGERRKLFAHSGRPREPDFPDRRVGDQVSADRRRVAEHEVEHTGRQAGVGESRDQRGAARRRILRALDDDRHPAASAAEILRTA